MTTLERLGTSKESGRYKAENRTGDRARRMQAQTKSSGSSIFDSGPDFSGMSQTEIDAFIVKACSSAANFGRMILGCDIYPKQEDILNAMLIYERLAIAGCNSSGKTFSMTPYSLWKLTMQDEMAILQIAPTRDQSRGVYWRDMRRMYRGSSVAQALLANTEMHNMSFEITDTRYAQAISPGDVMNLRGFHAPDMLFILDEGNGIDAEFFTAIDGITASGEIAVAQLGNPTENSGVFFDCFDKPELGWHTINISAFDSPNLVNLVVPESFDEISEAPGDIIEDDRRKLAYLAYLRRQYLRKRDRTPRDQIEEYRILTDDITLHQTRREFVANMEANYAKSAHASWFGQVLGVFPNESESQFFARDWLNRARTPIGETCEYERGRGPVVWGHDPNGMGQNEYALVGVQIDARTLEHRKIFEEGFLGEAAFDDAVEAMKPYLEETMWMNIDRMGPGERVSVELKRYAYQFGIPVYAVVSQQQSTNPMYFQNLKSQMYCYLRDMFEVGTLTGIDGQLMRQQLLSIRYDLTPRGQIQMESKKDAKKRGVDSPDRADALAYACFPLHHMTPWQEYIGS